MFSFVKYTFTLLGIGMLIGAFFLFSNTHNFLKSSLTTTGTVIKLISSKSDDSTTYRPVVEFKTPAGKIIEFTSSAGSNPPSYSKGEIVEVYYDEATPEKAKINGFFSLWGGVTILGILGAVFSTIGASLLIATRQKSKNIERLKLIGSPVKAKFQSVEKNGSYTLNKRNPYQIYAQWKNPMTSKLHIFKSDNIWFDPTDHIIDDEITVLIDRKNPKKYHMDISFLPEVAD